MKKNYLFAVLFAFGMMNVNAQNIEFMDDMEAYTVGAPIYQDHWTDWACGGTCAVTASGDFARSGSVSGNVPGDTTTDGVLDMGNKIFGTWGLEFYMYIPSGKEGYYNLQGTVPITAGEWIVGNINFNEALGAPGVGVIDLSTADLTDDITFAFPHDAWFSIITNVDISAGISAATWQMYVNGVEVVPSGTAFADGVGTTPTSLGGIDFFSVSADNNFYLDDFLYQDQFINPAGVQDLEAKGFSAYPNPVKNVLNLKANEEISSAVVYNVLGQEVYNANVNALSSTIDMSSFASGAYFVKVTIGGTEGIVKILK
jgi:hypothetical protein